MFGAPWYQFLGAGERLARLAEAGHWYPTVMALVIASVLLVWASYAWSGAGAMRRLPFVRIVLCLVSAIYIGRGLGFVIIMPYFPGNSMVFWLVSSAICLGAGLIHAIGLRQVWSRL
ncbi:hypothetical protein C7S18_06410 [Ahniella affigens]|uniref:Uncharacterized protein n=1 Tax=Ahniella affigens TaxID=2021234 RepID=A0A2P1PPT2_9GAMM|nr:hypothetical protein [Ahniella affigens]AVP96855.1 hypothetical protein C7S18_06410 [Ahniella affigens]